MTSEERGNDGIVKKMMVVTYVRVDEQHEDEGAGEVWSYVQTPPPQ